MRYILAAAIFAAAFSTFSDLLIGTEGQLVGMVLSAAAAISVLRASGRGLGATQSAMTTLGVSLLIMSITYAVNIWTDVSGQTISAWRRGVGYAIYACIIWAAIAARRFWQAEKRKVTEIHAEVKDLTHGI